QIGEVARIVHYLRKHLVNRTIASCQGFDDDIVYGKVGCTATAFSQAFTGKRVSLAGQQGKYFYLTLAESKVHSVLHLGMTGWIKFNIEETGYYRQGKDKPVTEEWPPKYVKWLMKIDAEGEREALEVAFVDPRRLARIRLVECEAGEIRRVSPLKENGPDPVIDKDIVTLEWMTALMRRKKVPVKGLLLDQANISGVGNWVADEVLYQARLHPEQYSNTFSDEEIGRLRDALLEVTGIACATLSDSEQFPSDWLMKHRWDKGKKASNVLPNGEKIVHLTVSGRTSAIVPSVQKKTGNVAGDFKEDDVEDGAEEKKEKKKPPVEDEVEEAEEGEHEPEPKKVTKAKKSKATPKKSESTPKAKAAPKKAEKQATPGERKSTRTRR
ncbi:uncharacterized protein MYCGRDRAFT_34505, partial [Zymoseptoria tritici IPO323]